MKIHKHTFTDQHGSTVDWSHLVGQPCKLISGHDNPITAYELEILCVRKSCECALAKALTDCKKHQMSSEALMLARQICG